MMLRKGIIIFVMAFATTGVMGEEKSGCAGGVEVRRADEAYYHVEGVRKTPAPTAAQILEWLKPETTAKIDKLARITLVGGEEAYLAAPSMNQISAGISSYMACSSDRC